MELLSKLRQEGSEFLGNNQSRETLEKLSIMFEALERSKCSHRIVFDLSLARGLVYYTGVIFEAVCIEAEVGTIGAGGRYDNLIGMFRTWQVPAVGVSLGIERAFNILEEQQKQVVRPTETHVLVSIMRKTKQGKLRNWLVSYGKLISMQSEQKETKAYGSCCEFRNPLDGECREKRSQSRCCDIEEDG